MRKLAIFQFKSITHRLIFGCVVSAIAIYGVSYWHARQLMQKTAGTWIIDLTQSRIDNATHNVETKLLSIERNVLLLMPTILQSEQNSDTATKDQLLPRLKFLLEQQSEIQAIALIEIPNSPTESLTTGWNYDRQGNSSNLNINQAREWLTRCDRPITSSQTSHQSFWTQPHSLHTSLSNGLSKSSITYCVPLATNPNIARISPNSSKTRYLATEIDLDWLPPLIAEQFSNTDEINYRELGDPFVVALSSTQWLVKPRNSQQVQSWLSQQNLQDISLHQGLIYTKVNPQGTLITKNAPSSDWIVGIVFPVGKLEQFQQKYLWSIIFSMSKDMVLMCVVVALISQLTTKPLRGLNVSTEEIAKGNLDTTLPEATSNDEVGRLTHSFRRMRDSLVLHIQDLQETTAAKQKLESELLIAAQIQRTMLPRINAVRDSSLPYDISAVLRPARIVGGDLYDFFSLGEDRLCLIIGDVADKGFPSALQMARTITLIRTLAKSNSTPSEILSMVNQELCAENEDCLFVTVFCGVLELSSGKFTYASG
jgi:phosphoserine phosphatase RsbU/P